MGMDCYSQAIIGVKIDNPFVTSKARNCKHPEVNSRFCPECGQPMWKNIKEAHPVIQLFERRNYPPNKYEIIWAEEGQIAFIGIYRARTASNRGNSYFSRREIKDINVEALKKELKEFLGDLYNENEFGLWSVLDISI